MWGFASPNYDTIMWGAAVKVFRDIDPLVFFNKHWHRTVLEPLPFHLHRSAIATIIKLVSEEILECISFLQSWHLQVIKDMCLDITWFSEKQQRAEHLIDPVFQIIDCHHQWHKPEKEKDKDQRKTSLRYPVSEEASVKLWKSLRGWQ